MSHRLTSKLTVLSLITQGKLPFHPDQVAIHSVTAITTRSDANTRAILSGVVGSNLESERTFYYTRRPVTDLVGPLPLVVPPTNQTNTSEIIHQLNKLYGFQFVDSDIYVDSVVVTKLPQMVMVRIHPTNPAWLGSFMVTISNPKLSIAELIPTDVFGAVPVDPTPAGKTNAKFLYYADSFSVIGDYLNTLVSGQEIDKTFITQLSTVVDEHWVIYNMLRVFNLKHAVVHYVGAVDKCPLIANSNYTHVCVVELDDSFCNNFSGMLYLHYDA